MITLKRPGKLIEGHILLARIFIIPAICAHCKYSVWSFQKHGYHCHGCHVSVHERCLSKFVVPCLAQNTDYIQFLEHGVYFDYPHKFEKLIFWSLSFCDHCGFLVCGFSKNNQKCRECGVKCHKSCSTLIAHVCGLSKKTLEEIANRIEDNRQRLSDHEFSFDETTFDPFSRDIKSDICDTNDAANPVRPKTLRFRKYSIDDFVFLKYLGKGSYGKVMLAQMKGTELYFAIKCMRKDAVLNDDNGKSAMIERKVLTLGTNHPYLCNLYFTFHTPSYIYYVMEYLNGGDLLYKMQRSRKLPESVVRFYGAEIVCALQFLHKRGIFYRDLKLDNIMIDFQGHIRLVDFGMCRCQVRNEECVAVSLCGTPVYMAPEVILGQKYDELIDWWAFGVVMYELSAGKSPFHGTDEQELFWSILNEEPCYPAHLSEELTDFIQCLLKKSPAERLGKDSSPAGSIRKHVFFKNLLWDFIEKKMIVPPWKPKVKGPFDTFYFDREFTKNNAALTPVEPAILEKIDQELFDGFSYTNPHVDIFI